MSTGYSDASIADCKREIEWDPMAHKHRVRHPVMTRHPGTGVAARYVFEDLTTQFDGQRQCAAARVSAAVNTGSILTRREDWTLAMVIPSDDHRVPR